MVQLGVEGIYMGKKFFALFGATVPMKPVKESVHVLMNGVKEWGEDDHADRAFEKVGKPLNSQSTSPGSVELPGEGH